MIRPDAADSRRLAKELLGRPRAAVQRMESKRGQLQGLEEQHRLLTLCGVPEEETDACREKISALRHELKTDAKAYAALLAQVQCVLADALPNETARRVMELRYLGQLTWDRVAECCYYTPRHVYRLHHRALQTIGEHMYYFSKNSRRRVP